MSIDIGGFTPQQERTWSMMHELESQNCNQRLCLELIGEGVNTEVRGFCGNTPLIWAAAGGYVEIVQALLDAGAHIDACDDEGENALHAAECNEHTSDPRYARCCELLRAATAEHEAQKRAQERAEAVQRVGNIMRLPQDTLVQAPKIVFKRK